MTSGSGHRLYAFEVADCKVSGGGWMEGSGIIRIVCLSIALT